MGKDTQNILDPKEALAMVSDAPWGLALVDVDGNFGWINDSYAKILNAPRDLISGTNFREWTHPEDVGIDSELAERVKSGEIPGYTLSKRYIQRGSTPQVPRVVWGFLSVTGKWTDGKFVGYRVQFTPYTNDHQNTTSLISKVPELYRLAKKHWKQMIMFLVILSSLMGAGSDKLLNMLQRVVEAKQSADSLSDSLSPGASHPQP